MTTWQLGTMDERVIQSEPQDVPREITLNGKRYIWWPKKLSMEAAANMKEIFGLPIICT